MSFKKKSEQFIKSTVLKKKDEHARTQSSCNLVKNRGSGLDRLSEYLGLKNFIFKIKDGTIL